MPNRSKTKCPLTRTRHPEPDRGTGEWIVWAAWADRVSFEYIYEQTGLTESDVIKAMRRLQTPKTFRRWRKRMARKTTKHRYRFIRQRRSGRHAMTDDDSWD